MSPELPGSPFLRPQPGWRADPERGGGLSCPRLCSLSFLAPGAFLSSPDLGKFVGWDDHDSHFQLRKLRPTEERGFARVSRLDTTYRSPRTTPMRFASTTPVHTHDRPQGRPVSHQSHFTDEETEDGRGGRCDSVFSEEMWQGRGENLLSRLAPVPWPLAPQLLPHSRPQRTTSGAPNVALATSKPDWQTGALLFPSARGPSTCPGSKAPGLRGTGLGMGRPRG